MRLLSAMLRNVSVSVALIVAISAAHASAAFPTAQVRSFVHTAWTEFGDPLEPQGVYAIAQDGDGYLWLGLLNGLVRFDGNRFVRWETFAHPSLPERSVTALATHPDGSLWIGYGNLGGISRFSQGRITHYSARDGIPEGAILAILITPDGTTWAVGYSGLSRFSDGRWRRIGAADGLSPQPITFVFQNTSGTFWVDTDAGFFRLNAHDQFQLERPSFSPSNAMRHADGDRDFAVRASMVFRSPTRTPPAARDHGARTWHAIASGVGIGRTHESERSPAGDDDLWNAGINVLFEDRQGALWVGTSQGLNVFRSPAEGDVQPHQGSAGLNVRAVIADASGIWAGTATGLHYFGPREHTRYGVADGLPDERVTALHHDRNGRLWVATEGGVAVRAGGRFTSVAVGDVPMPQVSSLAVDADDTLWLSGFDILYHVVDGRSSSLASVPALANQRAGVVAADREGRIWIGLWNGTVVRYDRGTYRTYAEAEGLATGRIMSIAVDETGTLWVGSLSGVSRLVGERFDTPNRQSLLSGLMVSSLVRDRRDRLWLRTVSGLLRMPVRQFEAAMTSPQTRPLLRQFDLPTGTVLTATGHPSLALASDDTLWMASNNGLLVAHPASPREHPPVVRVEGLTLDDNPVTLSGPLVLRAGASRVRFDFSAIELTSASHLSFRYRLNGFDPDWVNAGRQRQAVYTSLPAGTYTFTVAANHGDGPWGEATLGIPITVVPPFYLAPWFYALVAAATGLLLLAGWQLRLRQLRWQYSAVLAERARVGRELHDTLLQGMAGVALQLHGLLDRLGGNADVTAQVSRARDTLEHYVRETRDSIWDLRSSTLDRQTLADAIRSAGETLTTGTPTAFRLDQTGHAVRGSATVEAHLLRIAHEAIANAVRHGRPTAIRATLHYDDNHLRLVVRDNGAGFNPDDAATSPHEQWGLTTMRERAEQIGARFQCVSGPEGTTVETIVHLDAGQA